MDRRIVAPAARALVAFAVLALVTVRARAEQVRGQRQAYSTGKLIGRGGWSKVSVATPLGGTPRGGTQRVVAKRFAPRRHEDPAAARAAMERQFRRELGVLRRLGAIDGFPELLDHGRHDGEPFLVLSRRPGVNLHDWRVARKSPPSDEEVVDILLRAADRLSALHARGYQHRDVKPGNITIGPRGEVSVVDVGRAGARRARAGGSSWFMAPEQYRDGARSAATDVFGLASTGFFLMTGEAPFLGEQATAEERRARFEQRPMLQKIADPALRAIFWRAMEPAARDRHPTMAAFAAELRAWRDAR